MYLEYTVLNKNVVIVSSSLCDNGHNEQALSVCKTLIDDLNQVLINNLFIAKHKSYINEF